MMNWLLHLAVLATSLTGQVAAQRGDQRRAACLHFNIAGGSDRDGSSGSGSGPRSGDGSRVTGRQNHRLTINGIMEPSLAVLLYVE